MSILPEAMKTFRERFGDVRLELLPSGTGRRGISSLMTRQT